MLIWLRYQRISYTIFLICIYANERGVEGIYKAVFPVETMKVMITAEKTHIGLIKELNLVITRKEW